MLKQASLAICLALGSAPLTHADAFIELVPDNPGPYFGGENVLVEVNIHNLDPVSHDLRLIQWDLTGTDPMITLNGDFIFDVSEVYVSFPGYPVPSSTYPLAVPIPGLILTLPADGLLRSGWIDLTLPTELGDYVLDIGTTEGAFVSYGFASPPDGDIWCFAGCPENGLSGSTYTFTVIPEPASLWLLAVAASAAARARRQTVRLFGRRFSYA